MKYLTFATILAVTPFAGFADTDHNIEITQAVSIETLKTARTGAGYMVITNHSDQPDVLTAVHAEFPRVMMHDTEITDGVARMFHVETIEVPAHGSISFQPGGKHIMFMGLNGDPFEAGEMVQATLVFENAGDVDVEFKVVKRADLPKFEDAIHSDMDHSKMDHGDAGHSDHDHGGDAHSHH